MAWFSLPSRPSSFTPPRSGAPVARVDTSHVAGIVAVPQPALQVLLVQPGQRFTVQFDPQAEPLVAIPDAMNALFARASLKRDAIIDDEA